MSYARFRRGHSNIYLFKVKDGIRCDLCWLDDAQNGRTLANAEEAFWHAVEHCNAGHLVPDYTLERLEHEARTGVCCG